MPNPIIREYIGVKPSLKSLRDFPTEIINPKTSEFHFLVGFAIEQYDVNNRGTGVFKQNWNEDYFGPDEVKKLKEKYANVKVVISIGGCDVINAFNPANESTWPTEAEKSLKEIIQKYKGDSGNLIDGIDINFEHIIDAITDEQKRRFTNCIAPVIRGLRNDPSLRIKEVSITPNQNTAAHYLNLYWGNQTIIDLVHYQFYKQSAVAPTPGDFKAHYDKVAREYSPAKVIPGISTIEPVGEKKMANQNFIAGCIELLQKDLLHGIFLWNADESAIPTSGQNKAFLLEHFMQNLLT